MAKPKSDQNAITRYIREVRSEMSKVVWPTREQATNLTVIVMVVMVAMAIFLGVLDLAFGELIQLLLNSIG